MSHAYGPADDVPVWLTEMTSPDPDVREKALRNFYSAVHHQGDLYPCTAASLPFLFTLADDPGTPDRAAIVGLLLSIGAASLDHDVDAIHFSPDGTESTAYADIAAVMRERAEAFVRYTADLDPLVRRAAIEGVGSFLDDGDRAVEILRGRLVAESDTVERLLVVRTMVGIALRLPTVRSAVTDWLDALADDATGLPIDAATRLAALTHQVRLAPERSGEDLVPRAIAFLREITRVPAVAEQCDGCVWCRRTSHVRGRDTLSSSTRPEHLAANHFDRQHHWPEHSPVSSVIRALHVALGDRVHDRAALLAEQLTSSDIATRYDAVEMAKDFPGPLPRDLTLLVLRLLLPDDPYIAGRITHGLSRWWGSALSVALEDTATACDALAAYVATQRGEHGPDVWAVDNPLVRHAYQEAIMSLADHRDSRALPDVLTALETGVDDWRVLYGVGGYPQAAHQLVPLLADGLRRVDPADPHAPIPAGLYLSCLAQLGDAIAVPVITDSLTWALHHECRSVVVDSLEALTAFGTAAASAVALIQPLAKAQDTSVRTAAEAALVAIGAR